MDKDGLFGSARDVVNAQGESVTRRIVMTETGGSAVVEIAKAFEGNPGTDHPSGTVGPSGLGTGHGGHVQAPSEARSIYEEDPRLAASVLPDILSKGKK
jgi:hypothetical protein